MEVPRTKDGVAMGDEVLNKLTELTVAQRELNIMQANQQKLLEKHAEVLERQSETLLRNTITVEEHKLMSINLDREIRRVESKVNTIQKHVDGVEFIGKLIRWMGKIGAAGAVIFAVASAIWTLAKKIGL